MPSSLSYRSGSRADLRNGDCMSQEEFHKRYQLHDEDDFKAELLNGIVYVREPLSEPHGEIHPRLGSIFDAYAGLTSGIQVLIDATTILSKKDEVQPDFVLRIRPEFGGQSADTWYRRGKISKRGPYIKGAPELVAEIAYSSRSIDLHVKRDRYEEAGVLEYIVLSLEQNKLIWFDLLGETEIVTNTKGIFQSRVFPGLWIHERALLKLDYRQVMETIHQGIGTTEHQNFVQKLETQKRKK